MSNMKCPFCQQELEIWHTNRVRMYACPDLTCKGYYMSATKDMWQELIRTRNALDVAVDMLKLVYQGNGDPQDIMRYKDNRWTAVRRLCKQTLDQITTLEQKDK